jgi:ribonuclease BN (tRNA processing enzyme)
VISGDTAYSEATIALAKDADVLVHEAMHEQGMARLAQRFGNAARLMEHLKAAHTTTEDVGRVVAANVKLLVLSHLVPGDDPTITDEMWSAGARQHYRGPIIVGRDLMEI